MTRINVVDPKELSDIWLIAEYRELPRVLKNNYNLQNISKQYLLGKGHVKWAKYHSLFLFNRYNDIIKEMKFRGISVNFNNDLSIYLNNYNNDYIIKNKDIILNINRLRERYSKNPNIHHWTKRIKPYYLV